MINKECAACGKPISGGIVIGGAILCREHAEDVRHEIDRVRAEGGRTNAMGIARRMFRETFGATNYLLRDVPGDLMQAVKVKAAEQVTDVRYLLIQAMREMTK